MARAGFCFTLLAAGLVRLVAISFCVSVFASCCLCPCVVDKTEGQALEAARRSRKLAPQIPDAILYEGIALIGMSQNAEAIDVLQAALTDASGLKWQRIDTSRPDEGQELTDSKLSEALMSKTEFNHKEWEAFGIQDLRKDDFIKSGDTYFKPRDYACFKPGSGHERKLTMLLALALAKEDEV